MTQHPRAIAVVQRNILSHGRQAAGHLRRTPLHSLPVSVLVAL